MDIIDGLGRKVWSASIAKQARSGYVTNTKLWFSFAKAHRLPKRAAIIYHQNSIVAFRSTDLTLGAVSDVVAHDRVALVSASFALVAERPAMCDLAWIMRARPNDVDTALTKCFVSATNSEAARSPPKDQK